MQVEVSKYTEGVNDKALRPNGLPKSLIRYDGKHIYLIVLFYFKLTEFTSDPLNLMCKLVRRRRL